MVYREKYSKLVLNNHENPMRGNHCKFYGIIIPLKKS